MAEIGTTKALAGIKLTNLRTIVKEPVFPREDVPHIIMFMQPDCNWCKKQAAMLDTLSTQCRQALSVNVIGFNGKQRQLKRESRHYSSNVPVYMANTKLLRLFKGVENSPSFVFLDANGDMIAKQQGYLPPTKLYRAASILTSGECDLLLAD